MRRPGANTSNIAALSRTAGICLLLALVPPAAADPGMLPDHADIMAGIPVDVRKVEDIAPERTSGEIDPMRPLAGVSDDSSESCFDAGQEEMVERPQDRDGRLIFREDANERGCRWLRFTIATSGIAGAAEFSFSANISRTFSGSAPGAANRATTWVQMLTPDGTVHACWTQGMKPVFAPGLQGNHEVRLTATMPLQADCTKDDVVVELFIGDVMPADQADSFTVPRQALTVEIWDVTASMAGIRVDVKPEQVNEVDAVSNAVGYMRIPVRIDPLPPGLDVSATFQIGNDYGTLRIEGPPADGVPARIPERDIKLEEEGGILTFTILPSVVAAHGFGEYVVLFEGKQSGVIETTLLPLAAVALLAPLAAAVLAQRNVNHLHRTARGRERVLRFTLQGGVALSMVAYLGITFWLLISEETVGMAATPMPVANKIVYGLLVLVVVALLVIAFLARRREMSLVLEEFNELERTQAELERSNEELEQFAYVASHDLKEPLRMVAGYTQLLDLRYGKKLDNQGRQFLAYASQGATRLQNMVDDLLAYSRVRTDKSQLKEVDLRDVVTIVRGHLAGLIDDRNVQLQVGSLHTVNGEQGQLVQLLLNLVQNAVKFSPQDAPVVEISSQKIDGQVEIRVRDEGIGIDEKQQDRIFDIFQRLHLREEYEGNGIGLAMCRKIVEQHGGTIRVQSAPGQGSTFIIRLPERIVATRAAPTVAAQGTA